MLANKPKQATSGTQEQPRFKSNRPCRSRLMGKDVGRTGMLTTNLKQLSAAATLPSAILIDPAIPPDGRHSPRLFFDFVLCCVAGLALGIVAAFVRQSLSGAIYSQAEVEEASNLPVFGSIPDFRHGPLRVRRQRGPFLALRDDPDGPVSEAYRSVRQSLRFARQGAEPVRTFAFTSCAPGEGKTTTNINIAMAFAGAEQRVLLVDADMRKPTLHAAFDAPISPGLAEVLEARTTWRECVRPSGQPGLDLLCAGVPRTSPSELLRSASVAERIAEWTAAYDLVVFDLPPALAVADAEILANELDAVVLLYRSGGVHREALATMARKLSRAGANVVGAVVNAVQPTHGGAASYYGGYHAGYGRSPARKRGLKQAG